MKKNNYPHHIEAMLIDVFKGVIQELHPVQELILNQYKRKGIRADSFFGIGDLIRKLEKKIYKGNTLAQIARAHVALINWTNLNVLKQVSSIGSLTKKDMKLLLIEKSVDDPEIINAMNQFVKNAKDMLLQVGKEYVEGVQGAAFETFQKGGSLGDLKDTMQEYATISESRAEFWAVDQTGDAYAAYTETMHKAGGIENYMWCTVGDKKVRDTHEELQGRIFSWKYGAEFTGLLSKPGAMHPGQDYRCRCRAKPVVGEKAEMPK